MIIFRDTLFDGQLLRALGHCVYGGAGIGECLATAATIRNGDRDSWRDAWTRLADRTFGAAVDSEAGGHRVSAANAFLRASNYYRSAYVLHLQAPLDAVTVQAYRRQREAFERAAALMPRPIQRLGIPFEQLMLPGWFYAAGAGRRPLVICVGGYDSTAEESYFWNAAAALARGYHALTFDGPGQGSVLIEQQVPFCPDWERVIVAVIDAAVSRSDVDAGRVIVIGESFGGYLAARAAAVDGRIAACVLDPPQIGLLRAILARLPLPAAWKRQLPAGPAWLLPILRRVLARRSATPAGGWALRRGMLTHAVATPWDYFVDAARYEAGELIGRILCPTLVCDAEDDDISSFAQAFFEQLTCERSYLRLTAAEGAGAHCAEGNRALFHERVFDWLDDRCGTFAPQGARSRRSRHPQLARPPARTARAVHPTVIQTGVPCTHEVAK